MKLLTGRHAPFVAACGAAVLALVVALFLFPALSWAIAANAFFVVYLVLSLIALRKMSADWLKRHASSEDVPVWIIFLVGLVAVVVSVVLLFDTINARPAPDPVEYGLALAAVPLGWFTIHLMAAFHYAREYWQPESGAKAAKARQGLEFPGSDKPGGVDFVYFSFVVGMTAQTSDVGVTNTAMRRRTIVHGIVSFFFNTVIVAAAVNITVAMGK
jgi:uncharacterized membrane protein